MSKQDRATGSSKVSAAGDADKQLALPLDAKASLASGPSAQVFAFKPKSSISASSKDALRKILDFADSLDQ